MPPARRGLKVYGTSRTGRPVAQLSLGDVPTLSTPASSLWVAPGWVRMPLTQEKLPLRTVLRAGQRAATACMSWTLLPLASWKETFHLILSAGKGGAALGYPTFHQRSALSWQSPELITNDFEGLRNMNFIRKERNKNTHVQPLSWHALSFPTSCLEYSSRLPNC